MKTKEILKRSYYALTSITLFVILLNSWTPAFRSVYHRMFFYLNIGVCGVILTLAVAAYCWNMSRNNGKPIWKWYAGMIPVLLWIIRLIGVKTLIVVARNNQEFINIDILNYIFFATLMLYTAVITFCSKTKYDYRNILPNQTKTDTQIFKWLPTVMHIAIWGCFILILPTFINNWLTWWPSEAWVNSEINRMSAEFNQYFD